MSQSKGSYNNSQFCLNACAPLPSSSFLTVLRVLVAAAVLSFVFNAATPPPKWIQETGSHLLASNTDPEAH